MNTEPSNHDRDANDLGPLRSLPTVQANEFANWSKSEGVSHSEPVKHKVHERTTPFAYERDYRLCKAISRYPLKPSSQYAKLAGISSKTAVAVRQNLVAKELIRERTVDSGGRGRSTILLELLPAGVRAIAAYENPPDTPETPETPK